MLDRSGGGSGEPAVFGLKFQLIRGGLEVNW